MTAQRPELIAVGQSLSCVDSQKVVFVASFAGTVVYDGSVNARLRESVRVAALQGGFGEQAKVGSNGVDGSAWKVLPQLTRCRAEMARIVGYAVVSANNTGADTGVVPARYLGTSELRSGWAGLGGGGADAWVTDESWALRRGVRWWLDEAAVMYSC